MFVTVKLVKNVDVDKYKYSGYDIGFDRYETFSVANEFGRNVKLFGVDMNSSILFDNKKKNILALDEGLTQGIDYTTLTSKKSIQSVLLNVE